MKKEKKKVNKIISFIIIFVLASMLGATIYGIYYIIKKLESPDLESVYSKYNKAALSGNFSRIRRFISKKHQPLFDTYDEKRAKAEGQGIKSTAPTEYKVTGKTIRGDIGILFLEGNAKSILDGKTVKYGKVTFKNESGQWKILKESWADKPGNLQ